MLTSNVERLCNGAQYEKSHLPELRQEVQSPQLRDIIGRQIANSEARREHMNEILNLLQIFCDRSNTNWVVEHIIESAKDVAVKSSNHQAKDACVLSYMQQLSQYNLAEYGTAYFYSSILGFSFNAHDLLETMAEEREINQQLALLDENNPVEKPEIF